MKKMILAVLLAGVSLNAVAVDCRGHLKSVMGEYFSEKLLNGGSVENLAYHKWVEVTGPLEPVGVYYQGGVRVKEHVKVLPLGLLAMDRNSNSFTVNAAVAYNEISCEVYGIEINEFKAGK